MKELSKISTLPPKKEHKKKCRKELKEIEKRLFELQNKFYADGGHGLLVVLQGLDSSGKDGSIRHALRGMNPMGLQVKSFKKPTEEEMKHDFMWRIYKHIPERGMIQVFNRSHYEDIVVPAITKSLDEDILADRLKLINTVERHLEASNIHILKIYLHLSKKEQAERLQERMALPHKRWKYNEEDHKVLERYDEYLQVYDRIMADGGEIPWHIVPADKRWYRNLMVSRLVLEELEKLELHYPS